MNILYLLKVLKTTKMSELVQNIEAPQIDINIAVWDAIKNGEIEVVDNKKGEEVVSPLKEAESWHDPKLVSKITRVMQHYAENKANITRGKLYHFSKDVSTGQGYPTHEFLMSLQWMIDEGLIIEDTISVPEIKNKRPYHRFVFLCLPENDNQEWNAKAVNTWIDNWAKSK